MLGLARKGGLAVNGLIASIRVLHVVAGFLAFVVAPAAMVTAKGGAALVVLGIARPNATWARIATVAVVLGMLGVVVAGRDLVGFAWPSRNRQAWWFSHMSGMLGSYVATVTAFSAVNFTFLPLTARFLWPSVVGVPLIAAWVGYYRVRFSRRPPRAVAA